MELTAIRGLLDLASGKTLTAEQVCPESAPQCSATYPFSGLSLQNLTLPDRDILHRIPCIHDAIAPLRQLRIIHAGVRSTYHDYIKCADALLVPRHRFQSLPFFVFTGWADHRDMR